MITAYYYPMCGRPQIKQKMLSSLTSVFMVPLSTQYGIQGYYIKMKFSDQTVIVMLESKTSNGNAEEKAL